MTSIEALKEAIEKTLRYETPPGYAPIPEFSQPRVEIQQDTASALLADLEELEAYRRRIGPFLQGIADGQHEYEVGWHVAQIEESEVLLYELNNPVETLAKVKGKGEG